MRGGACRFRGGARFFLGTFVITEKSRFASSHPVRDAPSTRQTTNFTAEEKVDMRREEAWAADM